MIGNIINMSAYYGILLCTGFAHVVQLLTSQARTPRSLASVSRSTGSLPTVIHVGPTYRPKTTIFSF